MDNGQEETTTGVKSSAKKELLKGTETAEDALKMLCMLGAALVEKPTGHAKKDLEAGTQAIAAVSIMRHKYPNLVQKWGFGKPDRARLATSLMDMMQEHLGFREAIVFSAQQHLLVWDVVKQMERDMRSL